MRLTADDFKKIDKVIAEYERQIDLSACISTEEFKERRQKVQENLKKRDLDIGLFFWYREMPGDGIYLTGYNPTVERACGLIGQEGVPLVVGGPEAGKIAEEAAARSGARVEFAEEFQIPDEYYEGVSYKSIKDFIEEVAGKKIERMGLLTSLELIPVQLLEMFEQAIGSDVEIVTAEDILREMRYEKSIQEFVCMAQADKIASAAARAMLAVLKPGLRETQIAAVADLVMKSLGADSYGVETVVNVGDRCRTVIGPASNRVIHEGEILQIGCSPSYEGYKGVMRRVVVLGTPTARQEKYIDVLSNAYIEAEKALEDVVTNGREPKFIDLAARNHFAKHEIDGLNMKQFHTYSSAHGTGLTECLEPKVIGPDTTEPYGHRVGIMLDVGCYGHPNDEIAGGCVEGAYGKDGNKLLSWSDLPVKVGHLIGEC